MGSDMTLLYSMPHNMISYDTGARVSQDLWCRQNQIKTNHLSTKPAESETF